MMRGIMLPEMFSFHRCKFIAMKQLQKELGLGF